MRASIKLLHLGGNFGGVPRPVVPYGTLRCPPGGRQALAPGRPASSGPWAAGKLWPLGGREALAPPPRWSSHGCALGGPLVISRICPGGPLGHLTDLPWGGPWSSHGFPIRDPRLPVAILGELERIPEEVSGWNGSELNSERIHVRFSRNRRWNSGGWHRPGKAESGGFSRCRGPPDFFRAAARGTGEPGLHQAHTRRTPG